MWLLYLSMVLVLVLNRMATMSISNRLVDLSRKLALRVQRVKDWSADVLVTSNILL